MVFEVFKRRARPVTGKAVVGIQNKGTVSLNASAFHLLHRGSPEVPVDKVMVEFVYDPAEKIAGMRMATEDSDNAYPLRKQKGAESWVVSGKAFFQYHSLTPKALTRYNVRLYDGNVLGFSLVDDQINKDEPQTTNGQQANAY